MNEEEEEAYEGEERDEEDKIESLKERASGSERLQTYYNKLVTSLTTYDEVHMHLSLAYAMKGPQKSKYFLKLGSSVKDFCTNVTRFGEIERFL